MAGRPAPRDLVPLLRSAFPAAEIGGGVLTNFTEFNRCPPDPAAIDFATFGTTAIVHTADDRSVVETLRGAAGGFPERKGPRSRLRAASRVDLDRHALQPLRRGRSPTRTDARIAMAMADPRQATDFAAAWAVGAAAAAARGGVASFAPAMTAGPLGLGRDGAPWPLFEVVAALAALGGETVEVSGGPGGPVVFVARPTVSPPISDRLRIGSPDGRSRRWASRSWQRPNDGVSRCVRRPRLLPKPHAWLGQFGRRRDGTRSATPTAARAASIAASPGWSPDPFRKIFAYVRARMAPRAHRGCRIRLHRYGRAAESDGEPTVPTGYPALAFVQDSVGFRGPCGGVEGHRGRSAPAVPTSRSRDRPGPLRSAARGSPSTWPPSSPEGAGDEAASRPTILIGRLFRWPRPPRPWPANSPLARSCPSREMPRTRGPRRGPGHRDRRSRSPSRRPRCPAPAGPTSRDRRPG